MKSSHLLFLLLSSSLIVRPAPPPPTASPDAIVLKADATAGVTLSGKAKRGAPGGTPEFIASVGMTGEPLIHLGTWSKPNPEEVSATFSPKLPKPGHYDVYVRWYAGGYTGGCTDAMPIRLTTADHSLEFRLSQRMGNVWAFLGTHRFDQGSGGSVIFDARGTHGASNVNAVAFVPSAPPRSMPKVLPGPADSDNPFVRVRRRFADNLTPNHGADLSDPVLLQKVAQEEAESCFHWATLNRGEEITELWNDPMVGRDLSKNEGGGWPLVAQYRRITAMAKSYVGGNGPLGFADKMQGNPELLADILYALEFFYENRYNERTQNKLGADWIANEINQPHEIATVINLIHPHVSPEFIAKQVATFEHMAPSPFRMYGDGGVATGFNRMFACHTYALRGLMANNAEKIATARDGIATEYRINRRSEPLTLDNGKTTFDGFYDDGTFVQHEAFPYIGIYGRGLLEYFGKLKSLLEDSPWELTDPGARVFHRYVTGGYAPLFFNGDILYGSLGRSTGQSWHQNGSVSSEIISAIAPLVPLAETAEARNQLAGILKAWLLDKQTSAYPQFNRLDQERVTVASYGILNKILDAPAIQPIRPEPGTYLFYNSDYLVHHQPEFAVQLRMSSTRMKTHENLHQGTNKLGWYQGEGTLFVYNRDNSRYQDHFWATVDPYRLPGITVDTRSRKDDELDDGVYSESPWAGGVTLGQLGMAGMGLQATGASLSAHKAWFFFDDQIVCLGAGISSSDARPVETVVENAKLHGHGQNALLLNGEAQPTAAGWNTVNTDTRWAHLAGTVPGTDLGWVFPDGSALHALREDREGRWVDSFRKDSPEPHIRRYLTLWFDHGANPDNADYAYIVLPGRSAARVRAYADSPEVRILANRPELQAVAWPARSVLAASFWTPEPASVAGLSATGPANVILQREGEELRIAVSDPTQTSAAVVLEWEEGVKALIEADPAITVDSLRPLRLKLDVTQSDGRPLRARFTR